MKKTYSVHQPSSEEAAESPRKVFVVQDAKMENNSTNTMERLIEAKVQSLMVTKFEEEIRQLRQALAEKEAAVLALTRENAELRTTTELKDNLVKDLQVRLDKVDAVVNMHDKSVHGLKESVNSICMKLSSIPAMTALDPKEQRKVQSPALFNSQKGTGSGYGPPPGYSPNSSEGSSGVGRIINPNVPVYILLIGDTTFKYIDEDHLFSKPVRCTKFIVPTIEEARSQLPAFLAEVPNCIVVHLGTHDVEFASADALAQRMQDLVHTIKELAPSAEVCVSLLLPRGDNEQNKVKAQLFNFKVQEILQRDAHFIIHSELEKDGRLIMKYYQTDYVSINGLDGSRKLAAHLKHGIRRAIPALQPVTQVQAFQMPYSM